MTRKRIYGFAQHQIHEGITNGGEWYEAAL